MVDPQTLRPSLRTFNVNRWFLLSSFSLFQRLDVKSEVGRYSFLLIHKIVGPHLPSFIHIILWPYILWEKRIVSVAGHVSFSCYLWARVFLFLSYYYTGPLVTVKRDLWPGPPITDGKFPILHLFFYSDSRKFTRQLYGGQRYK